MFPNDTDSTVHDFDILGYLGQGKMLFALQAFVQRISVKASKPPPGPTPVQVSQFVSSQQVTCLDNLFHTLY